MEKESQHSDEVSFAKLFSISEVPPSSAELRSSFLSFSRLCFDIWTLANCGADEVCKVCKIPHYNTAKHWDENRNHVISNNEKLSAYNKDALAYNAKRLETNEKVKAWLAEVKPPLYISDPADLESSVDFEDITPPKTPEVPRVVPSGLQESTYSGDTSSETRELRELLDEAMAAQP